MTSDLTLTQIFSYHKTSLYSHESEIALIFLIYLINRNNPSFQLFLPPRDLTNEPINPQDVPGQATTISYLISLKFQKCSAPVVLFYLRH